MTQIEKEGALKPRCNCIEHKEATPLSTFGRRDFIKSAAAITVGAMTSPLLSSSAYGDSMHRAEILRSGAVMAGKAQIATILHTADIHGQLYTHDEFFVEDGQVVYKNRGGLAVLKTMLNKLRAENPDNTLLIDGGDCFQGSGVAAMSEGKALVPLMNNMAYDLVLPGNWEVAYKKEMMISDLSGYNAAKICANMFHKSADDQKGDIIFKPYWIKTLGGVKIGFVGYTDHNIPKRQPPAYSKGIHFTNPLDDVAKYIKILKEEERCAMVFLVTHFGLAQQVNLANNPEVQGTDFILGADTHERVRSPIVGRYAQVTEPGAFGSFVSRLDLVIEDGVVKDKNYELLDVDPTKYKADREMARLIEKERAPFKNTLDTVIGECKIPLVRYYVMETPMDNMITDALMWKFKPDIALSNGFRFCPPLVPDRKTGRSLITMDYLWSMLPINSEVKSASILGSQLWNWLERELHNVFAKDPGERLGGWVIRMQGLHFNFTMNNEFGKRLNWVTVNSQPLELTRTYSMVACEREGDPDTTLCRLVNVIEPTSLNVTMHQAVIEYLQVHSPVSPRVEGRVTATDAPPTLLSQLEGYGYSFF